MAMTDHMQQRPIAAMNNSPDMASGKPDQLPGSQMPGHPSFRRQRASRACETCHARKVRCDAASLGVPCTNCVAFQIECKIPTPKRKKQGGKREGDSDAAESRSPSATQSYPPQQSVSREIPDDIGMNTSAAMPETEVSSEYARNEHLNNTTYAQFMKPKFARAPIREAGRVAYLGESSNLSLLVQDRHGTVDVVHYPLPENIKGPRAKVSELDSVEIDILHQRGAFLLPPRALCDELVDAYFTRIAPVVPVINRSKFMRRYRDSKNPPSLLLLQAILLAGSRVCNNPQLMDANGSTTPAAMTFYKRAKALYDANYEDDRVTIVQALILMGWYWEGPEDVTKNVFYWTRVALVIAQGSGMHRSVEGSQLSRSDKRLWKRIWWTLFTRDRSVAVALGRPIGCNIEDSDVEMLQESDFLEDEPGHPADPPDPVHVAFFLNYVKLTEIMGLVLAQQYSVASKQRRNNALDLTHSDMALADWLQNCSPLVKWEPQHGHNFWAALLNANYYTTLCLLHRAHMPPSPDGRPNNYGDEASYPSRNIAYQAAGMITSIVEALQAHDQLRYAPAFIVYSLFSALIMHVYQMRSSNQSIVEATQQRLTTCMNALRDVSKVWLVAKMVHTLFESILGNKMMEERLQKAAGRRHTKLKNGSSTAQSTVSRSKDLDPNIDVHKRKFEEMELGYTNGQPAPQMSYERSRPQSPVATPGRETQAGASTTQGQGLPNMPASSPVQRQGPDTFMGRNTRPTTPFNTYSYPGTPPELFLHTRNSPKISDDLWQNYAPEQLFPPEANNLFPTTQSPTQSMVDPALRSGPPPQQQQVPTTFAQQQMQGVVTSGMEQGQQGQHQMGMPFQQHTADWTQLHNHGHPQQARSADEWSNSSSLGPSVPTTLNVGDWFEFFGIPNNGPGSLAQGIAAMGEQQNYN